MAEARYNAELRVRLMEVFSYDPKTGIFRWLATFGSRAVEGDIAGHVVTKGPPNVVGYRYLTFEKIRYRASRVAWLFIHGEPVPEYVDHDNRVRSDDWIDNLRAATNSQNCANSIARVTSKSGVKGVSWDKKQRKWSASLCVNYKQRRIGRFDTIEEAAAAYETAARAAFGEFARTTQE